MELLHNVKLIERAVLGEIKLDVWNIIERKWEPLKSNPEILMYKVREHEDFKPPEEIYVNINPNRHPPHYAHLSEREAYGRVDRDDEETLTVRYILADENYS